MERFLLTLYFDICLFASLNTFYCIVDMITVVGLLWFWIWRRKSQFFLYWNTTFFCL